MKKEDVGGVEEAEPPGEPKGLKAWLASWVTPKTVIAWNVSTWVTIGQVITLPIGWIAGIKAVVMVVGKKLWFALAGLFTVATGL